MHLSISQKIGLVLLVPVLGALVATGIFWTYFTKNQRDYEFMSLVGQQYMLSEQLHSWSHMVAQGQDEDRPGLLERVQRFDQSLIELQAVSSQANSLLFADGQKTIKENISAMTALWQPMKPQIIQLAGVSQLESAQIYERIRADVHEIMEIPKSMIDVYQQHAREFRKNIFWALVVVTVLDLVLLFAGLTLIKHYVRERRITEGRLRKQTQIIGHIPDAVLMLDHDGIVTSWNKGAERMFGYGRQEILGQHVSQLFAAEERETMNNTLNEALAKQDELDVELQVCRKDDQAFYAHFSLAQARDANGRVTGIIIYGLDISDRKRAEHALQQSNERFRGLVESTSDWVWEMDANGVFTYVSPQIKVLLGYEQQDVVGKTMFDFMPDDESVGMKEQFVELVTRQDAMMALGYHGMHKNGLLRILENNGVPFFNEAGKLLGYRGIGRDITERQQTEQALIKLAEGISSRSSEGFFRSLVNHLADTLSVDYVIVVEIDEENPAIGSTIAVCALGESVENFRYEFEGTPCQNVLAPEFCVYENGVQKMFPQDQMLVDLKVEAYMGVPLVNAEGKAMGHMALLHRKPFENLEFVKSIFQIYGIRAAAELERRLNEHRLQYLAHFDHLTGLPNRTLFIDRLENALTRASWWERLVAVMFVDLDHFKAINDAQGHAVGDAVLKAAARRLQNCLREGDSVARLGGDEFVILLDDVAQEQDVIMVSEKLVQAFAEPFSIDGFEYYLSISIGVSVSPRDGSNHEDLMHHADLAMYVAKEEDVSNYRLYEPIMNVHASEKAGMEQDLRFALEREEFELLYQPRLDLSTNSIVAVEALIRWNHPELGVVQPAKFIPLLEETGLMVPVGEWVLNKACRQIRMWQDAGASELVMSINVSTCQFKSRGLTDAVAHNLKEYALDPDSLQLEISETVLIDEYSSNALHHLHEMGVRLIMDDFGTGYSALSYLKRFPISVVKIDSSLVRGINVSPDETAITKALIAMTASLGMEVVAEGVENEAQLQFLKDNGCMQAQGKHLFYPLTVSELERYLPGISEQKQNHG